MSNGQVTIAIDAMGGENSPYKVLKGAQIFQNKNQNVKMIFFGNKTEITSNIRKFKIDISNYEIVNTTENVQDDDNVNTILRSRKDSSIYRALEFVKKNPDTGFVSAGNTAAIMVLSRLHLGMIEGIDRPAICSLIPNKKNYSLMLDLGANVTVNPENLFQAIKSILNDPSLAASQLELTRKVVKSLGFGDADPADRAADSILKFIHNLDKA